ncbi:MAG: FAD-dependent oxidoreductase [Bdellovibrionota bacterium]
MNQRKQIRMDQLTQAESTPVDVVVIGGGITGAGCLLNASERNLRGLLLEQNDYSSGTSWASTKLIHGGLRYLETFDFKLVFESCKERKRLLKEAPDLTHRLEFLFPIYKGQRRGLWTVWMGTWLYYVLSFFWNLGTPTRHGSKGTLELEPEIEKENLEGSVVYADAQTSDSQLTVSTILSACDLGGMALNYVKVKRIEDLSKSLKRFMFWIEFQEKNL